MYSSRVRRVDGVTTAGGVGEYVYSWRTGPNSGGNVVPSLQYPTPNGRNLLDVLSKRKRFYEDLDQSVGHSHVPSHGRQYRGDTGHTFLSIKSSGIPMRFGWKQGIHSDEYEKYPSYGSAIHPWMTAPPSTVISTGNNWAPARSDWGVDVKTTVDRLISNLVPRGPGLGETIVELVGGNVPLVLTSLRKNVISLSKNYTTSRPVVVRLKSHGFTSGHGTKPKKRVQQSAGQLDHKTEALLRAMSGMGLTPRWLSAIGSDYLELQFGLLPTLGSFAQALGTLIGVTDALYGPSFRRKGSGTIFMDSVEQMMGSKPDALGRMQWAGINGSTGNLPGRTVGGYRGPRGTMVYSAQADVRLSLRASLTGRPTGAAAQYYTEPENWIRKLGMWYPSLGWDLLPYSWLVDWALHLGSAIERSSFFGPSGVYPIDYAYVTLKSRCAAQFFPESNRQVARNGDNAWGSFGSFSTTALYRQRYNPFGGIGVDLSGLTGFQYSILAALGLARFR